MPPRNSFSTNFVLLGLLAVLAAPGCTDSRAGAEIVFEDESELFPAFEFSTGLQPEGAPVQASFTVSAEGTAKVRAVAVPSGSEDSPALTGLPATGSLAIEGGFALVGQLKADLGGAPSYDGPIPGLENVVISFSGSTTFDPFAVGTAISTRADIPPSRLPGIPLPGGLPGQLVLEIVEGSFVEVDFTGSCAGIDGMQASYFGAIARGGSLVIKPLIEVEVPIVGTKTFEIPTFPVDLALGSSDVQMTAEVSALAEQPAEGDQVDGTCHPGASGGAGGASGGGGAHPSAGGGGAGSGGSAASGGSGGSGGGLSTKTICIDSTVTVGNLELIDGDAEFNGHGPIVTATVTLSRTPTLVTLEPCVEMIETVSDWTRGVGCRQHPVAVPNAGLLANPSFYGQYTDTDTLVDDALAEASTVQASPNLVKSLQCVGDTSGDDICSGVDGSCSKCTFVLGCFTIVEP